MFYLDLFKGQLKYYQTSISDRVLPAFSQIESEAEDFERRETERLQSIVNPEMDHSRFAELIQDRAIDYYISLRDVRQGIVNLLTAGLYHLFEQQMTQLVKTFAHLPASTQKLFPRFIEIMKVHNCSAESLPNWDLLCNELRLVANAVKHGPGPSADELAVRKPDYFRPEHMKSDSTFDARGHHAIKPIAGEGLFLSEDDFTRYAAALIEFWDSFSCWKD